MQINEILYNKFILEVCSKENVVYNLKNYTDIKNIYISLSRYVLIPKNDTGITEMNDYIKLYENNYIRKSHLTGLMRF